MDKRNIFVTSIAVVILAVASLFVWKIVDNQPSSENPTPISQSDWKMYENTAYQYRVKHPQTWYVAQVLEEERGTIEESRMIVASSGLPDGKGYFAVTTWDPSEFNGKDQASIEFRQSISVDLRSFAEAARQREVADKGHILPDKRVGELREDLFAGQKVFSYEVTGSYDGRGGDSAKYLFIENKGVKFMIYYSLNTNLPQQIANTFEFTNSSTTAPIQN